MFCDEYVNCRRGKNQSAFLHHIKRRPGQQSVEGWEIYDARVHLVLRHGSNTIVRPEEKYFGVSINGFLVASDIILLKNKHWFT